MFRGYLLRDARVQAGYTQAQLGELVHVTGSTISNWENEKSLPDNDTEQALVAILGRLDDTPEPRQFNTLQYQAWLELLEKRDRCRAALKEAQRLWSRSHAFVTIARTRLEAVEREYDAYCKDLQ